MSKRRKLTHHGDRRLPAELRRLTLEQAGSETCSIWSCIVLDSASEQPADRERLPFGEGCNGNSSTLSVQVKTLQNEHSHPIDHSSHDSSVCQSPARAASGKRYCDGPHLLPRATRRLAVRRVPGVDAIHQPAAGSVPVRRDKPTCAKCPVHVPAEHRNRLKPVMRFAGPECFGTSLAEHVACTGWLVQKSRVSARRWYTRQDPLNCRLVWEKLPWMRGFTLEQRAEY